MKEAVRVAMADLQVVKAPLVLITIGLGSCVGVTLYDPIMKIGGMAHIMLPYQQKNSAGGKPGKYADSAVPYLLQELLHLGAVEKRIEAKLAGGAQMFPSKGKRGNDILRVGERNVEATLEALKKARIRIVAQDTGGNHGRTLEFATLTGSLRVKTIAHGEKHI
ncbi:MAG: chemotaxis protein CheD [Firmicutes bacterium]|nr:chemotaxis protein CheD [Bacillota bacterium]